MYQPSGIYVAKFLYDFSKNGGAVGDITTGVGCINMGVQIPKDCLVNQITIQEVITPVSAGNAATLSIGEITNSFRTGISTNPFRSGNYYGTGSGFTTSTLGTGVFLAIAVQPLTAGKFYCWIQYLFGPSTT